MPNRCLWVRLHILNLKIYKTLKNRFSSRIATNVHFTFLDLVQYYWQVVWKNNYCWPKWRRSLKMSVGNLFFFFLFFFWKHIMALNWDSKEVKKYESIFSVWGISSLRVIEQASSLKKALIQMCNDFTFKFLLSQLLPFQQIQVLQI